MSEALVLYLAGGLDEDRPVAVAKGFREENLIAIEHDYETAARLRARGTLTLVGDAFEHATAWNPRRKIDVCVLDLCGGLTEKTAEEIELMIALPQFANAVIAVNMLRGRDASGNELRQYLAKSHQDILLMTKDFWACRGNAGGDQLKHRGLLLQTLIMQNWVVMCMLAEGRLEFNSSGGFAFGKVGTDTPASGSNRIRPLFNGARFQCLSYRSTAHQTFDTLVFCNALAAGGLEFLPEATAARRADPRLVRHKQQQSAILAHRTRRILG